MVSLAVAIDAVPTQVVTERRNYDCGPTRYMRVVTIHSRKFERIETEDRFQHLFLKRRSGRPDSDVQIGHQQGVLLNKVSPRFDLIAHEGGENLVCCNNVFDLHL